MPKSLLTPAAEREAILARLGQLPTFYSYKDVLASVFEGDEDAFTDALCSDTLSLDVRLTILDTMQPRTLETMLLRRIVRQLNVVTEQLARGTA